MSSTTMRQSGIEILRDLEKYLNEAGSRTIASPNRLEISTGGAPTVVTLREPDGSRPYWWIEVSTTLTKEFEKLDEDAVTRTNEFAALCVIVQYGDDRIVARNAVALGADVDLELAVAHLRASVRFRWESLDRLLRHLNADTPRRFEPLPGGAEESRWSRRDFERSRTALEALGVAAEVDDSGLSAEVNLWDGPLTPVPGLATIRLAMQRATHPFFGNGLAFSVHTPKTWCEEMLMESCRCLNGFEPLGAGDAPFIGAWTPAEEVGKLDLKGFVPNLLYLPQLAPALACWLAPKGQWMARLLNDTIDD